MHYTVVVDLEMCGVSRMNRYHYNYSQEIIQIGATLLDENLEVVDGFDCYVKPQFGDIDNFIHRLTGISRADVARAHTIDAAIEEFARWLPEDATMVSWSMSDRDQFVKEMTAKQITNDKLQRLMENWIDCQPMFSDRLNNNRLYRLEEALIAADIDYIEEVHNGAADAYNTALLYTKMVKNPNFELNDYYASAQEAGQELTMNISSLFAGIDLSGLAVA